MRDNKGTARAKKVIFFANTDWYLFNFRLGLARYLRDREFEVVMMSPPGDYSERFSSEGFRWIGLPMDRRSLDPLGELRLLNRIRSIYRDESPDAVHNFTIKSVVYGSLAGQAAGIRARVNAVTGLGHVFISDSMRARILRPLVRGLLKQALRGDCSRLILQNPDDRRLFLDAGLIDAQRIELIRGSGVDSGYFRPEKNHSASRFRVLLASRLLWEKGIREYAEAARRLLNHRSEIEFLLAGSVDPGNPSAVSVDQLQAWEEEGLFKVLGHIADMRTLLATVNLVVLPSYREGVPRGLIEAASMGLPIVTTDAPGCREIVEDGVNGLLVPVGDGGALAEAIEKFVDNPVLCEEMGAAGREKVLREFDQEIVFSRTWEVYRSLGLGA